MGTAIPPNIDPGVWQSIAHALERPIERVRTPVVYRAAMMLVAAAMVLLPLIYLGMVGLVGYGTYWHAVHNASVLKSPGDIRVRFVIYFVPLVIGFVIFVFMIKPLFAPRGRPEHYYKLAPGEAPILEAFIARLCQLLGAPIPREIHLGVDVNASAHLRRGLRSFFGKDLVLTIGLPLVSGLTLREFTGLLAHEFGHFSQGGGMRCTYLTHRINAWFARVVYERDAWDQALVEFGEEDPRAQLFGLLLQFCVWSTRRVLWVLMHVGHALSCFLSRQMEYAADQNVIRVAGSAVFEPMLVKTFLLDTAFSKTVTDLQHALIEKRLVDNLPDLVMKNETAMPEELREQITTNFTIGKAGLFDTHPSAGDRLRVALQAANPGTFDVDEPASVLFGSYAAVAKRVTLNYYEGIFDEKIPLESLLSAEELLAEHEEHREDLAVVERYFQGLLDTSAPLCYTPEELQAFDEPPEGDPGERLRTLRAELAELVPKVKKTFGLQGTKRAAWRAFARQPDLEGLAPLAAFEDNAKERFQLAMRVLDFTDIDTYLENTPDLCNTKDRLLPAYKAMIPVQGVVSSLPPDLRAMAEAAAIMQEAPDDAAAARLLGLCYRVRGKLSAVYDELQKTSHPFPETHGTAALGDYLMDSLPDEDDIGGVFRACEAAVKRFVLLQHRLLGKLSALAEQVEQCLGLEPLPRPTSVLE